MRDESNEWQVRFRRETRQLRNSPGLKDKLDEFYAELRTSRLSGLRKLPEKTRQAIVATQFQDFVNILINSSVPQNEHNDYLRAVRKIIYNALDVPFAGDNIAPARPNIEPDPTQNRAAQDYLSATLDLRTKLTFNHPLTRGEVGYLKDLFNFSKRLTHAQNAQFKTEEARAQKVTELVKDFAEIVGKIPKEKLGDIDIQNLKKQVRKIIFEALTPQQNINAPDSPRLRR